MRTRVLTVTLSVDEDADVTDALTNIVEWVQDEGVNHVAQYAAFADDDFAPPCPACGNPMDYCIGHGVSGDALGWSILNRHDAGDHSGCHPASVCGLEPQ
jgi:hypothetical protein